MVGYISTTTSNYTRCSCSSTYNCSSCSNYISPYTSRTVIDTINSKEYIDYIAENYQNYIDKLQLREKFKICNNFFDKPRDTYYIYNERKNNKMMFSNKTLFIKRKRNKRRNRCLIS